MAPKFEDLQVLIEVNLHYWVGWDWEETKFEAFLTISASKRLKVWKSNNF